MTVLCWRAGHPRSGAGVDAGIARDKGDAQANGSTPSNLDGQAFWERAATDPPITQVVANQHYSIWVGVQNGYGCADGSGIMARVLFGDASLGAPMWTDVIPTSDKYFASPTIFPPFPMAPRVNHGIARAAQVGWPLAATRVVTTYSGTPAQ